MLYRCFSGPLKSIPNGASISVPANSIEIPADDPLTECTLALTTGADTPTSVGGIDAHTGDKKIVKLDSQLPSKIKLQSQVNLGGGNMFFIANLSVNPIYEKTPPLTTIKNWLLGLVN